MEPITSMSRSASVKLCCILLQSSMSLPHFSRGHGILLLQPSRLLVSINTATGECDKKSSIRTNISRRILVNIVSGWFKLEFTSIGQWWLDHAERYRRSNEFIRCLKGELPDHASFVALTLRSILGKT